MGLVNFLDRKSDRKLIRKLIHFDQLNIIEKLKSQCTFLTFCLNNRQPSSSSLPFLLFPLCVCECLTLKYISTKELNYFVKFHFIRYFLFSTNKSVSVALSFLNKVLLKWLASEFLMSFPFYVHVSLLFRLSKPMHFLYLL